MASDNFEKAFWFLVAEGEFTKQDWIPWRQASSRSFQEKQALGRQEWAGSQGSGGQLPDVLSGPQELRGLEAHCSVVSAPASTVPPAPLPLLLSVNLHFNRTPPVVACMHIKIWEALQEPYPGAALYMKEKLVFLLVAPWSRETLINILLHAEAFLL